VDPDPLLDSFLDPDAKLKIMDPESCPDHLILILKHQIFMGFSVKKEIQTKTKFFLKSNNDKC